MLSTAFRKHWYPWQELNRLPDEMNRIFSGFSDAVRAGAQAFPPVNVYSGEDRLVVTAEVPGLSADDIDITVEGDALTIKGSRPAEELQENEKYHRRERGRGEFSRTLRLPFKVDASKTDAEYDQGVLTVVLHKPEESKPKKITVKRAS